MTARTEIERYKKRSHSFSNHNRKQETGDESDVDIEKQPECSTTITPEERAKIQEAAKKGKRNSRSISVCVASLQQTMKEREPLPRTMNDYQYLAPEQLTVNSYELRDIRMPSLSISEVFHEPPPVYVVRRVQTPYVYKKPEVSTSTKILRYLKKHRHVIIAWGFGITTMSIIITIIILQTITLDVHH
ncbi:hypothetical protein WR25_13879 [Diploscapter pachys]|uniref:Uncharacterized protein n=1 Tax=Diploscapter pachys TaxID=2018661 RepID=A0A2A2L6X1_9BILA|nr:hypothetical protein WR25_13879 [Diploscapter pachys]